MNDTLIKYHERLEIGLIVLIITKIIEDYFINIFFLTSKKNINDYTDKNETNL